MTFRKAIGKAHLWLGLLSGLVVFIVSITGAIYAFQPEITAVTQPWLKVKAQNKPFVPISALKEMAQKELPGKKISRILYKGGEVSVGVSFTSKEPAYSWMVYLNPYTGEVIKTRNMERDFFRIILKGHMDLWLPDPVGHYIVIYSTLIFTILLITGIILWWPKSKARRKNSFNVKWGASPKRLNYDLHNVLGFYISWIILFAALTGLVWGFDLARDLEYRIFSGGKQRPVPDKLKSTQMKNGNTAEALDQVYHQVSLRYPAISRVQYLLPANAAGIITVRVYPEMNRSYNADYLGFDQYTAEEIPFTFLGKYERANGGEKANRMTYDIHVGAIGGLSLRILVFFSALIAASLPVTGLYIWWGKFRKQKNKKTAPRKKRMGMASE